MKSTKGNPSTPGKGLRTIARERWLKEQEAKKAAVLAAMAGKVSK